MFHSLKSFFIIIGIGILFPSPVVSGVVYTPLAQQVQRRLSMGEKANHLIKEKSPYLLQHAFNPVDWYPWGDEAFARAKEDVYGCHHGHEWLRRLADVGFSFS